MSKHALALLAVVVLVLTSLCSVSPAIANPVGTFWTACMMLEHLGETDAAARLMRAIEQTTADSRYHTPDLGGQARTREVTAAVIDALGT